MSPDWLAGDKCASVCFWLETVPSETSRVGDTSITCCSLPGCICTNHSRVQHLTHMHTCRYRAITGTSVPEMVEGMLEKGWLHFDHVEKFCPV